MLQYVYLSGIPTAIALNHDCKGSSCYCYQSLLSVTAVSGGRVCAVPRISGKLLGISDFLLQGLGECNDTSCFFIPKKFKDLS